MIYTLIYQISTFLATALLIPVTFRTFNAEDYNVISFANSLIALGSAFIVGPTLHAVSRFYNRDIHDTKAFYRSITIFAMPSAVFVAMASQVAFYEVDDIETMLSLVLSIYIVLEGIREAILSYLNANEKKHAYGIFQTLSAALKLGFVFLIAITNYDENRRLYILYFGLMITASVFTTIVSTKLASPDFFKNKPISLGFSAKRFSASEWHFFKGFAIVSVLGWSLNWTDKWFLSNASSESNPELLASYLSGTQLINAPYQLLLSAVLIHFGPKLYYSLNTKSEDISDQHIVQQTLSKIGRNFVLLLLVAFLCSIPVLRPVCSLILGSDFKLDNLTIIAISAYASINAFNGFLAYIFQTLKLFKKYIAIQVLSSLTLFIALIPLIKAYEILGAALALFLVAAQRAILLSLVLYKNGTK